MAKFYLYLLNYSIKKVIAKSDDFFNNPSLYQNVHKF